MMIHTEMSKSSEPFSSQEIFLISLFDNYYPTILFFMRTLIILNEEGEYRAHSIEKIIYAEMRSPLVFWVFGSILRRYQKTNESRLNVGCAQQQNLNIK